MGLVIGVRDAIFGGLGWIEDEFSRFRSDSASRAEESCQARALVHHAPAACFGPIKPGGFHQGPRGFGAPVAELVDATDSKSVVRKDVLVRVRPGVPIFSTG